MSYYDFTIGQIPVRGGICDSFDKAASERLERAIEGIKSLSGEDAGHGLTLSIQDNGSNGDGTILSVELYNRPEDEAAVLWLNIPNESLDTLCEALEAVRRLRKAEGE